MRVKWNRQLDGSLTRRQGEEASPGKDKECKQKGSPKFFRLFRRKKTARRLEDGQPPDQSSLYTPAPSEADEDDCASVSSVASQPVSEVCHRDRTLSIFSSFRIGFPGVKKKPKRAPLPPEDHLFQPEKNRYSSPDLRKDRPDVPQTELSMSSPSVVVPSDFASLGELRAGNSQSFHQLRHQGHPKLAKSVSFSDCQEGRPSLEINDVALERTVNGQVEEMPKAPRRKRLALPADPPRSNGESKSTLDGPADAQIRSGMRAVGNLHSRVQNSDCMTPSTACVGSPAVQMSTDSAITSENTARNCSRFQNGDCITPLTASASTVEMSTDFAITSEIISRNFHSRVRNGDNVTPFTASIDRPKMWVKRDFPSNAGPSTVRIPEIVSEISMARNFCGQMGNGDLRTSLSSQIDHPRKWVRCDAPAKPTQDPFVHNQCTGEKSAKLPYSVNGTRNVVPGEYHMCRAPVYTEMLPEISTSSELSNAKITAADTYVSLPGTCISISNFVEELAVRNASKENLFPVSVPDCDGLNLNGSPSSESANALSEKSNAHQVKLETSPEPLNTDNVHTANCVKDSALRSDQKDTMLSMVVLDYPANFLSQNSVNCDLKDNIHVRDVDYPDISICNSNLNDQDGKVIDCIDLLSESKNRMMNSNTPTIDNVLNSERELSDPSNEAYINIHQSDHVTRDCYNNLKVVSQVNEPAAFLSTISSETICDVNEPVIGNTEKAQDLNYNCQKPVDICVAPHLPKEHIVNMFDYFSSRNELVSVDSIEFLQRSNCGKFELTSNSVHCLNLLSGDNYMTPTELTSLPQPHDHGGRLQNRSILNSNWPFLISDSTNNNCPPDVGSYLQKLVVSEECSPFLGWERHPTVWNASFVRNACGALHLDCGRGAAEIDRDVCANDRGKRQDRCPDASALPMSSVTLRGPDLHTEDADTPQYSASCNDESGRGSAEGSGYVGGDTGADPAMLCNSNTDMSVGVYDAVYCSEIRSGQIYDTCRYASEGCRSGSPEISGDSCFSDESSLVQGEKRSDSDTCTPDSSSQVLQENTDDKCCPVVNGHLEGSSEKHSDTCRSPGLSTSDLSSLHQNSKDSYRPVINGYLEDLSGKQSDTVTCVSVELSASESSLLHQDSTKVQTGNNDQCVINGNLEPPCKNHSDSYETVLSTTESVLQEAYAEVTTVDNNCSVINGCVEGRSENHFGSEISASEELSASELSSLPQDNFEVTNVDNCRPVINVCVEGLYEKQSDTKSCAIVELNTSESFSLIHLANTEGGDNYCPLVNGYLKSSCENISEIKSPPEGLRATESSSCIEGTNVDSVVNGYLDGSSGDESYVESLLLTGELTEELISTTLRTDTGLSGTLEEEEASNCTISVTSDCERLLKNSVLQESDQPKMPDIVPSEDPQSSVCSNADEDEIPYEGVKDKIHLFDSNSLHISLVTSTPDIASEERPRRKSSDKGKNSMIPSLKKKYPNAVAEKHSAKTKKPSSEKKCIESEVAPRRNQDAPETVVPNSEKPSPQIHSKTTFDCHIIRELQSDYKCLNGSGIDSIQQEAISDRCKSEEILSGLNPPRDALTPVFRTDTVTKEVFDLSSSLGDRLQEGSTLDEELSSPAGGEGRRGLQARCASLPLVMGQVQPSVDYSRRNLLIRNKDVATGGRSRIPRKQSGARGTHPTSKPVRPPMWLSKAELTQEIQRLGNLCEARTKELNRLKMETKHVSVGFDAFAALFKYMVEDLNALSVPMLSADLQKTLKQLELAKQDLAYYEREVEEMKAHHCQELNDLSNKLFEVFQGEVTELSSKHQEEMNHLNHDHQKQIENLTTTLNVSSAEAIAQHEELVAKLQQELINQREEIQLFQEREITDLEEKHTQSTKTLQEHIEQLQKKCAELKQHSMGMEDAMRKDTDSKLQWVTARKVDLAKEVESLKAVLEMKNKELHTIRVQNLEMEKQLEELPLAREKIKMLQARAEDLEALMIEKTKLERKLSTENHEIRETYEKESKVNRRLSMENEELQWRLRQAEQSLISGSFSEVLEYPEEEENGTTSPAKSPSKSPGAQVMSRSVFFTFVDKDQPSPKSQYKKITPGFSASYKTSPAKSSRSPPAPSPQRSKSHSEPPVLCSTPRKVARQTPKQKSTPKRQRSGSETGKLPAEHSDTSFLSVGGSMTSSVSSESSVFEHKERLLEEHKEQIMHSLEILREQRNAVEDNSPEDMSRSSEFSDPKTYYHMTFPVLKEAGMQDGDVDDGGKVATSHNDLLAQPTHSKSNGSNSMDSEAQFDSMDTNGAMSQVVNGMEVERKHACVKLSLSNEDVREADCKEQTEEQNMWRTI